MRISGKEHSRQKWELPEMGVGLAGLFDEKVKTLGASDWEEASGHFKVDNAKVPLGSLGLGCVHLLYLFWTYT